MTFIQNHIKYYTVSQLCSALKFPRNTYYKALVRVPSNRQKEYEEFNKKVKQAYEDSKQRYGAVKICHILNAGGTPCSIKRVQRHMAEQVLRSVVVKQYNHHANHGTVPDNKENILKREFEAEAINQKWCKDITYIHVQKEGWTYLASMMELCSRKIIGYAYGTSMTAELAVEAVKNACRGRCGKDHAEKGKRQRRNFITIPGRTAAALSFPAIIREGRQRYKD